jgi:hypothetical protein
MTLSTPISCATLRVPALARPGLFAPPNAR